MGRNGPPSKTALKPQASPAPPPSKYPETYRREQPKPRNCGCGEEISGLFWTAAILGII